MDKHDRHDVVEISALIEEFAGNPTAAARAILDAGFTRPATH